MLEDAAKPEDQVVESESPGASNSGSLYLIGTLAGLVAAGWLMISPILGHMGSPWPCFVLGIAVLTGTVMAFNQPARRVAWGLLALVASIFALLVGQGAVAPGVVGLLGAAMIVSTASATPEAGVE